MNIVNCKAERLVYGGASVSGRGCEVVVVDRPVEDYMMLLFKRCAGRQGMLVPLNRSYGRYGGC